MEKTPRYTEGGTRDPRNPETEPPGLREAKAGKLQERRREGDGSTSS